jgi:dihydrofolate synthase/folylpolyglutamate synthase
VANEAGESHRPYERALEFLRTRTNYEQVDRSGAAFGLEPMRTLLARLGHPEAAAKMIHVAGTKGKGSVTWFIDAFLRRAGARTGRYLSPHLRQIEERIAVAGRTISPDAFGEAVLAVAPHAEGAKATFFDVLTAAAWVEFARERVELAVVETGLGGRLDSTNANDKISAALTAVGLEHTDILGNEVGVIAEEKARIARRGVPLFSASPEGSLAGLAIARVAGEIGAPLGVAGREFEFRNVRESGGGLLVDVETVRRTYLDVRLPGPARYQLSNVALAVAVIDDLEARGFVGDARAAIERPPDPQASDLAVPGRFEVREQGGATWLLDGAHTRESLAALFESVDLAFPKRRRVVVFGTSRDKDLDRLSSGLAGRADLVLVTQARTPRAASAEKVGAALARAGVRSRDIGEVDAALAEAKREAGDGGLVVVTGSLYLVGDAMAALESQRS